MSTKRLWLTLEASKADAITAAAQDYGISVSGFAGLCAWVGYTSVMRQIKPESMLTPEFAEMIVGALEARGFSIEDEVKKMRSDDAT